MFEIQNFRTDFHTFEIYLLGEFVGNKTFLTVIILQILQTSLLKFILTMCGETKCPSFLGLQGC